MLDVQAEIAEITALQEAADSTKETATDTAGQARERLMALRQRITEGETTGDRWQDFVLVRSYGLDPGMIRAYREAEALLAGCAGQFALLLERTEEPMRHVFGKGSSDYQPVESMTMIVIGTEEFSIHLENRQCFLAAEKCAYIKYSRSPTVSKGGLDLSDYGSKRNQIFRRRLPCLKYEEGRLIEEAELVIGDDAVHAWFRARADDIPFPREGEATILCFAKMAELLGRPLSDRDYPVIAEERERNRKEMKENLVILAASALKQGGLTDKQTQEIKALLRKAISLAMADMTLLSIRDLCEEYGVEIPT